MQINKKTVPNYIDTVVNIWLRGKDLNQRPPGYGPGELPDCSTPRCDNYYNKTAKELAEELDVSYGYVKKIWNIRGLKGKTNKENPRAGEPA